MKLNFDQIDSNLSPSLLKILLNFIHYYFKNRHIASVKHNIIGKLTDREFLLTNVIATSTNTTMKLNDDQILEIYELLKHQDSIGATLCIGSLNLRHSTNEIYKTKSDADISANFKSIETSVLI